MNTSHMEEFDVIENYLRHGDYPIGRYQYIKDKKIMVAVLPVQQQLQVHWLTCGVIANALTYLFSRGDSIEKLYFCHIYTAHVATRLQVHLPVG